MAMDKSTADKILKDYYAPAVVNMLGDRVPLLKWFERKKVDFSGRQWRGPIEVGRNESFGAVADSEFLPGDHGSETVGNTTYTEWLVSEKYLYGTCKFSGPAAAASKNEKGSFVRVKKSEMDNLVRSFSVGLNHLLNSNGSGALGKVASVASPAVTLVARSLSPIGGSRFVKAGQYHQWLSDESPATAGTVRNSGTMRRVSTVSTAADAAVVTYAGAVSGGSTVATGDFLYRARSRVNGEDTTNVNNNPMGIAGAIDDGTECATFQGVTRSSYELCNAHVLSNSGTARVLTKTLMQLAVDRPDEAEGDEGIQLIHTHHSARRAYVDLLNDDIRYVAEEARGGFANAKLTYNGGYRPIPIQTDRHCRYGCMYFIDPSSFSLLFSKDFGWLDDGNGAIIRFVSGKDVFEAHYAFYGNLFCSRPNVNSVIKDLSYSFS